MINGRTKRRDDALQAIETLTMLPTVLVRIEGRELIAAFDPDVGEHERRSAVGAGPVTSRALLYGLWLLPAGVRVPNEAIPEVKLQRLRAARHFAYDDGRSFERLYSPAGAVRAIAIAGSNSERNVEHAIRFTPIVQRVVVADSASEPSSATLDLAERWGIGVVTARRCDCEVLVQPAPAVVGVPAVYRWWLAELAYESWIQQSAQPVS